MYASKTTRCFYDAAIHGDNMPGDVVEISAEEHAGLMAGQSAGQVIDFDTGGRPFLADRPAPSLEQQAAARRAEILADLERIDTASARPLRAILVGSATDEDRAKLTELDEQAAALRAELATLESQTAA